MRAYVAGIHYQRRRWQAHQRRSSHSSARSKKNCLLVVQFCRRRLWLYDCSLVAFCLSRKDRNIGRLSDDALGVKSCRVVSMFYHDRLLHCMPKGTCSPRNNNEEGLGSGLGLGLRLGAKWNGVKKVGTIIKLSFWCFLSHCKKKSAENCCLICLRHPLH